MDANLSVMQEPSLLEILQFQYPNVLSAQSMGADHAKIPTIQSVKDLIDVRTTVFLRNFLPGWQDSGLLDHMSHAPPKVKTPKAGNTTLVPLEALGMAQEMYIEQVDAKLSGRQAAISWQDNITTYSDSSIDVQKLNLDKNFKELISTDDDRIFEEL
ncbi:hypothetical protein BO82DRAFT_433178 [Aspergillus uvarum CBS 121591]|uniref:Uncharacterized protein n=1 Tax=Aspergillus uvarum CBS 121591 TaxID=1448315 RepID=A0A319C8V5_9EURO|nr:hypothetical protein BO82DRAFT_433178 [Aspergillus uvarum CBS 121591]PYH80580.1 hypothetical protein BO82DRAFT_433178 [Aspergillus uvarum CBS 121591]